MVTSDLHVVFGYRGAAGSALAARLHASGRRVRGVSLRGRAEKTPDFEVVPADVANPEEARRACRDASVVYACLAAPYTDWPVQWPKMIEGLLAGVESAGARLVFLDNLYAYGPQQGPLVETMPPARTGIKPALRARMTDTLLSAHAAGRTRVAIARASDFYGPGTRQSALGAEALAAAIAGKRVIAMGDPDAPHSWTYLPDLARALATLGEHDDATGEIWHVPNAPPVSLREAVSKIGTLAGTRPRVVALPAWTVSAAGLFAPMLRELAEMRHVWDRPYVVDHGKFAARFHPDATPFDLGLRATLDQLAAKNEVWPGGQLR